MQATAQAAKTVTTAKKAVAETAQAIRKAGSLLYKVLRGTFVYAPNVRKEDMSEQPVVALPKGPKQTMALLTSTRWGQCASVGPFVGQVADLGNGEGLNAAHLKGAKVMPVPQLVSHARKTGKACKIQLTHTKAEIEGHLVGALDRMYVWFVSKKGDVYSLDTKALPKGRNKTRLFTLVTSK